MKAATLDLSLLRTFAAVADAGSFTAAGELVARTQSAVSVQIRRLEDALGKKVLERTSRSISLTPAGETLLAYARRILELNDETVRRVAEPPVAGRIRVGITEYFVPGELPRILARFAAAYPGVEVEVRMGLSRDLRELMSAGALDAAIVAFTQRERAKALWSEPLVWAAREGAAPARGETVPLAVLPPPCWLREQAIEALRRAKRPVKLAFTGSSMASLQAAVSAGLGVSVFPRSSILSGMQALPRSRDFPGMGQVDIGVVRSPRGPGGIVDALERVVRQTLDVLAVARAA